MYCFLHTALPRVGMSYGVCHNQKPRVLFFTPDCREFACHSVFVTTRSVVCCLLHRIGWTWPVIMCACHNQKPRVFFFQQDCQELEFHSVFVTFRSLVKFVGPILRAACRSKSCCRLSFSPSSSRHPEHRTWQHALSGSLRCSFSDLSLIHI